MYGGLLRPPYKNVRFGYSIYLPMQKSTFNSYNLFHDVTLIKKKHGKFVFNCTNFAFYTIKTSAQEYVSEVGKKPVLSGQPS